MEKHETKTRNHILCFLLVSCPSFLSFFPTLSPLLLPSFLPSSLPSFLPSFISSFLPSFLHLPSFIPSFISSFLPSFSSFLLRLLFICLILWSTLINPYLPCVAHQTTMDTVRQHLLPRAPPGCSRACAWQAKWSSDTHGVGWISRTPMANRSWGSVETWNERNVGGFGGSSDLQTLMPKEMRS